MRGREEEKMKQRKRSLLKRILAFTLALALVGVSIPVSTMVAEATTVIESGHSILTSGETASAWIYLGVTGAEAEDLDSVDVDITGAVYKTSEWETSGTSATAIDQTANIQIIDSESNDSIVIGLTWDTTEEEANLSNTTVVIIIEKTGYQTATFEMKLGGIPSHTGAVQLEYLEIEGYGLALTETGVASAEYTGTEIRPWELESTVDATADCTVTYYLTKDGGISEEYVSIPSITNVGKYTLSATVSKEKYQDLTLDAVAFEITSAQGASLELTGLPSDSVEYDDGTSWEYTIIATAANSEGTPITNEVTSWSYSSSDGDVATISIVDGNEATLKIVNPGVVTVTVTATTANYGTITKTQNIVVTAAEDDVITGFGAIGTIGYTLNENKSTISEQKISKVYEGDTGAITYEFDDATAANALGLAIDSSSGEVTISYYTELIKGLEAKESDVYITVNATKTAGSVDGTVIYPAAIDDYTIQISFASAKNVIFDYAGTVGENDWYTTDVAVTASGYTLSTTGTGDWLETITYTDGEYDSEKLYAKDADGNITSAKALSSFKIATGKPSDLSISYSEDYKTQVKEALSNITFGFYNPTVTITFTATDKASGIASGIWSYTEEGKTDATATGDLEFTDEDSDDVYTAELTLTASEAAQYRGNMSFTATNVAGLETTYTDDDNVIVVDNISPEVAITYTDILKNNTDMLYLNNDSETSASEIRIQVTESNFFEENVVVSVSTDGGTNYTKIESGITWKTDAENDDVHTGTIAVSNERYFDADGEYIVKIEYSDYSENMMEKDTDDSDLEGAYTSGTYTSPVLVLDETPAVLDFEYNTDQSTTFTIEEVNFDPSDISVVTVATDINGNTVTTDVQDILQKATWTKDDEKDIYTYTMGGTDYADGIYNLTFNYTDTSGNVSTEVTSGAFIIDDTIPADLSVEYSTPLAQVILNTITFGYYKPNVTATFTAYDVTSGVATFDWNYTQATGTSDVNLDAGSGELTAVQDKSDLSKFTAAVTLTATEAEQLNGNIAFTATDKKGNTSDKVTDSGNVLIVDTISPTMDVEYSESSRVVGTTAYYDGAVTATFTVEEANFFAEDVVVTVAKDGGTPYAVTPAWTDNSVDEHVGEIKLSGDGDYVINVTYTDKSTNEMAAYTSDVITIDTINPTVSVSYNNANFVEKLTDTDGNARSYFDGTRTAVITIVEHNFDASEVDLMVNAENVTGTDLATASLVSYSNWETDGDTHTITVTYKGDANYTFDVAYTDLATNEMANYAKDYFTVDKTSPTNLNISYSQTILSTVLETISFGFYNAQVTVTISAEDSTSSVHEFDYSYENAGGVSSVNAQLLDQKIAEAGITYSQSNRVATATFTIPKDTLTSSNQFNGTIDIVATDRSDNYTELADGTRIVVDNILPTATVTYNEAVNTEDGVSYYDGAVTGTITIEEANFDSADVQVMVSYDGGTATALTTSWSDNSVDTHTGSFTLSEDGDYVVTIEYVDKSSNTMETYTSEQLTVDTEILEPVVEINGEDGNGMAFKDDVVPSISFEDINYDNYELTLTRTTLGNKDVDVTDQFFGDGMTITEDGGTATFDTFEKIAENDGIYTLTVSMTDKAGHETETVVVFTVNRYGSVYEYNDVLTDLIADGGAFVQSVEGDLVITEYNADQLVEDSLYIEITLDGKPLDDVAFETSTVINDTVAVGSQGWYEYAYTISQDNFAQDGVYKITVASADATGNTPENSNYEGMEIQFYVDATPAEITSITGLENNIVNATEVTVNYQVFDAIALASVVVYVDGEVVDTIEDFGTDLNNYTGSFVIAESSAAQVVKVVVTDLAGNITDTSAESFSSAYAFNTNVTVSTNVFVRWYANKTVFAGSIAGAIVVIAGASYLVVAKKRKKNGIAK